MKGRKRLFFGILGLSFVFFASVLTAFVYSLYNDKTEFYRYFIVTIALFFLVITILVGLVLGVAFYVILFRKSSSSSLYFISNFVDIFYPVVLFASRTLQIKEEKIEQSYIAIKNFLFNKNLKKYEAKDILILAPHCIQYSGCKFKVTYDIDNCKRCGQCQINDLVNLKEKYGINVAVATGGTMARKIVRDLRPKVIIAIACERDLTSGMQDVKQIPVYGIINDRPNGPCFNTKVDVFEVENTVKRLLNGG
ncbi:DUF116 domain-containing protein [Caldanaerobacter sp.]|uniref:DUF116 domain-containing protein n=1 Tax=Caldanaerobacter sp. TaxID=2930036 RepID=UPI003C787524